MLGPTPDFKLYSKLINYKCHLSSTETMVNLILQAYFKTSHKNVGTSTNTQSFSDCFLTDFTAPGFKTTKKRKKKKTNKNPIF